MLGTRIALLRLQKGLSQAELGRRLGVSASAVGMYEQERRSPPLDLVVRLAKEFGVTTDYLLTGVETTVCPAEPQTEDAVFIRSQILLHLLHRATQ